MSNEIIKMVAEKAHISESAATKAVETVLNFLKSKAPGIAGTLESFMGDSDKTSSAGASKSDSPLGGLGDIAGKLGGLFGGKK